jgi:hypothetical protein
LSALHDPVLVTGVIVAVLVGCSVAVYRGRTLSVT